MALAAYRFPHVQAAGTVVKLVTCTWAGPTHKLPVTGLYHDRPPLVARVGPSLSRRVLEHHLLDLEAEVKHVLRESKGAPVKQELVQAVTAEVSRRHGPKLAAELHGFHSGFGAALVATRRTADGVAGYLYSDSTLDVMVFSVLTLRTQ